MKEQQWRKTGWTDSDLAKAHRIRSIGILLGSHKNIWNHLFLRCMPRLRDKKYIFGNAFNEFNSEEKLLIRASMDFLDSTGELPLH